MLDLNTGLEGFGGAITKDIYDSADNGATQSLINNVLHDMEPLLESRQFVELNKSLKRITDDYSFSVNHIDYSKDFNVTNDELISYFVDGKTVEGLSPRTLDAYERTIRTLLKYVPKGIQEITTDDVKYFMRTKQEEEVSVRTINNYVRNLKSLFKYLTVNGLIYNNPMTKIHKIKEPVIVKKPFNNKEIVQLRYEVNKRSLRDAAMLELLLSSGMRVGELVGLKLTDVNLSNKTCIVLGKGNKERICYFNETCKFLLDKYINEERKGNDSALFVSFKEPYVKLGVNGVERRIRELGRSCGIENTHPHRFRRTFATNLLKKGVPIEQIKEYLGHDGISTTQLYAIIDESQLKHRHKKLTD